MRKERTKLRKVKIFKKKLSEQTLLNEFRIGKPEIHEVCKEEMQRVESREVELFGPSFQTNRLNSEKENKLFNSSSDVITRADVKDLS